MNENQPLAVPALKPHPIGRGIGAFSSVHFPYSILALLFSQILYTLLFNIGLDMFWLLEPLPIFLCALLLMVPYFLFGLLMGRFSWSGVKTRQELVCNTLSQSAIAWGWAALVLVMLASLETGSDLWRATLGVMALLLPCTLFLAFPSCMLVLTGAALIGGNRFPLLAMACWAVVAGALPPLLFNLGNYLTARKRIEAIPEETDKKSEV